MRLAIYAGVAASVLSTLWHLVGESTPPASVMAADLFRAIYFLAYVAFAAGLWRFGSVPASTGAARPARQSFMCLASMPWLLPLASFILNFAWSAPWLRALGTTMFGLGLLVPFVLGAIGGACIERLVHALGAALRSLGEPPSAWAPGALVAYLAWWVLSTVPVIALWLTPQFRYPNAVRIAEMLSRPGPSLEVVLGPASYCAIALILASVMGRTARALARQESPETASP